MGGPSRKSGGPEVLKSRATTLWVNPCIPPYGPVQPVSLPTGLPDLRTPTLANASCSIRSPLGERLMCGIAGSLGPKAADSVLIVALERLKYRGYDSAGMAVLSDGEIHLRKAAGKLKHLADKLEAQPLEGHCGIAHTRWATHGAPTESNSHPHVSSDGRIAVVHNGIIENHEALRRE